MVRTGRLAEKAVSDIFIAFAIRSEKNTMSKLLSCQRMKRVWERRSRMERRGRFMFRHANAMVIWVSGFGRNMLKCGG